MTLLTSKGAINELDFLNLALGRVIKAIVLRPEVTNREIDQYFLYAFEFIGVPVLLGVDNMGSFYALTFTG